jgi:4-hydroxy-tetrahydrodipicolinate reductase
MILGPTGEMGSLICKLALKDPNIDVVAILDVKNIGDNLGQVLGCSNPNELRILDVDDLSTIIKEKVPDVVVDFTTASATEKNALICVQNGLKCIIGTTGMSDEFYKEFESLIKKYDVPAVISPNMSTGINVLFELVKYLTPFLKDWDIEIIETHHHRKKDSPSGTALKIANLICESLGVKLDNIVKYGRDKGINKRKIGAINEIGIHSVRGGDIVGDHTILFAGSGERIELKHQAQSRICFAEGAIKAIKFLNQRNIGKIFTTKDVLNI